MNMCGVKLSCEKRMNIAKMVDGYQENEMREMMEWLEYLAY